MRRDGLTSTFFNLGVFLLGVFLALQNSLWGQGIQTFLTHDQIQRDLDSLSSWIQQAHPAPWIHCSEQEYQDAFQQASEMFLGGGSLFAAAQSYSRFTTVIKDSHTTISLNDFVSRMDEVNGHLPFEVVMAENRLVVRKSYDPNIPPGAEIISVDAHPARTGIGMAMPMVAQEGNAVVSRLRLAERLWNDFMPLTCGAVSGDSLDILYRIEELENDQIQDLSKLKNAFVRAQSGKSLPDSNEDAEPLEWRKIVTPDGYYFILRISSFHPEKIRPFRKSLKSCFQSLNEAKKSNDSEFLGLMLDLRGNLGGHIAVVAEILPYFLTESVRVPFGIQIKSSPFAEEQIAHKRRNFSLTNKGYRANLNRLNEAILETQGGDLSFVEFLEPITPRKKLRYQGPMALLMDGLSASASVSIASWFIRSNRGKTFGEPPMGSVSGTFGNPITLELPESQIKVQIATARYFTQNPIRWESNPILPDVPVAWTQKDFLNGNDPVERAATQWLIELNQ